MNINHITESQLAKDLRHELDDYEAAALAILKLDGNDLDADSIVRAINEYVDMLLDSASPKIDNETITQLATLWGLQICRRLNWEWVELTVHSETWYGIVSPLREYAIFPFVYMREVLTEKGRENTILLIYNMLKAGRFSPADAGSYRVLE